MQITRIFHSGFLVETAKRYFIFDYYKGELPKLNPDKPVYVFASHGHQDHYEPKVFELLKQQGIVPVSYTHPSPRDLGRSGMPSSA